MLRIKLSPRFYVGDEQGSNFFAPRQHAGWDPTMTEKEVYDAARVWWRLSERAEQEKYAIVVADGLCRMAIEIKRWETSGDRRGFEGRILKPGTASTTSSSASPTQPSQLADSRCSTYPTKLMKGSAAADAAKPSVAASGYKDTTSALSTPGSEKTSTDRSASSSTGTTPMALRVPQPVKGIPRRAPRGC